MANNTVTNNGKNASELIGLIDSRAKKVFSEENKGSLKTKIGSVISYDDANYSAVVFFPEEGENSNYTYYNKTSEVLAAGDTVRVYYTINLATGWIGARGGEPVFKQIEIDGVGVGRPSPWDVTSEYFNAYGEEAYGSGTPTNIAGTDGETGYYATARGFATQAKGRYSYAEGFVSTVGENAEASHAEGSACSVNGENSHVEGRNCSINESSSYSHAEGRLGTIIDSTSCHVENDNCSISSARGCHAEGLSTTIIRTGSGNNEGNHTEGAYTTISDSNYCHVEGMASQITNCSNTHVEGSHNIVKNSNDTHVGGYGSKVDGCNYSLCNGATHTMTNSSYTYVGGMNCLADNAFYSYAHGYVVTVKAPHCHAEGQSTTASAPAAHAEGQSTTASAPAAHAEGNATVAGGECSHVGGLGCAANGFADFVHGEGLQTSSEGKFQTVFGKYNVVDGIENMLFVIGNGSVEYIVQEDGSKEYVTTRSNAFSVDKDGNVYCKGTITSGGEVSPFVPYTTEQAVASAKLVFTSVMEV